MARRGRPRGSRNKPKPKKKQTNPVPYTFGFSESREIIQRNHLLAFLTILVIGLIAGLVYLLFFDTAGKLDRVTGNTHETTEPTKAGTTGEQTDNNEVTGSRKLTFAGKLATLIATGIFLVVLLIVAMRLLKKAGALFYAYDALASDFVGITPGKEGGNPWIFGKPKSFRDAKLRAHKSSLLNLKRNPDSETAQEIYNDMAQAMSKLMELKTKIYFARRELSDSSTSPERKGKLESAIQLMQTEGVNIIEPIQRKMLNYQIETNNKSGKESMIEKASSLWTSGVVAPLTNLKNSATDVAKSVSKKFNVTSHVDEADDL
jgi:hypothetical protein